jgi:hypothetical protein
VADPHPIPRRAGIYRRVSTDKQEREGTSLDEQERLCRELAEREGYEVVEVYTDGLSGADREYSAYAGGTPERRCILRGVASAQVGPASARCATFEIVDVERAKRLVELAASMDEVVEPARGALDVEFSFTHVARQRLRFGDVLEQAPEKADVEMVLRRFYGPIVKLCGSELFKLCKVGHAT